jgi:hypothetical protein
VQKVSPRLSAGCAKGSHLGGGPTVRVSHLGGGPTVRVSAAAQSESAVAEVKDEKRPLPQRLGGRGGPLSWASQQLGGGKVDRSETRALIGPTETKRSHLSAFGDGQRPLSKRYPCCPSRMRAHKSTQRPAETVDEKEWGNPREVGGRNQGDKLKEEEGEIKSTHVVCLQARQVGAKGGRPVRGV